LATFLSLTDKATFSHAWPALLYGNMQSLVTLQLIAKWTTSNDPEWLLHVS